MRLETGGYNSRVSGQPMTEPFRGPGRLESWQEIAAYLKRSERTVRRWEEYEVLGEVPLSIGDLGYALAAAGARAEAERMLDTIFTRRAPGFHPAFPVALDR
jgi:hypothetical protein